MNFLAAAVTLLVVGGFAVKQATAILMTGSVFEYLRREIGQRAREGSWFFGKMNELLGCRLCASTQSALWLVALPTVVVQVAWHPFGRVLGTTPYMVEALVVGLVGFIIALATSASALGIWGALEFLPKLREAQEGEIADRRAREGREAVHRQSVLDRRLAAEVAEIEVRIQLAELMHEHKLAEETRLVDQSLRAFGERPETSSGPTSSVEGLVERFGRISPEAESTAQLMVSLAVLAGQPEHLIQEMLEEGLELLKSNLAERESLGDNGMTSGYAEGVAVANPEAPLTFTLADFEVAIAAYDRECSRIGCPTRRRKCRERTAHNTVQDWWDGGGGLGRSHERVFRPLVDKLARAVDDYVWWRSDSSSGSQYESNLKKEVYQSILDAVPDLGLAEEGSVSEANGLANDYTNGASRQGW